MHYNNISKLLLPLLAYFCFGIVQCYDFDPPEIFPRSHGGYYVYKKGQTATFR